MTGEKLIESLQNAIDDSGHILNAPALRLVHVDVNAQRVAGLRPGSLPIYLVINYKLRRLRHLDTVDAYVI